MFIGGWESLGIRAEVWKNILVCTWHIAILTKLFHFYLYYFRHSWGSDTWDASSLGRGVRLSTSRHPRLWLRLERERAEPGGCQVVLQGRSTAIFSGRRFKCGRLKSTGWSLSNWMGFPIGSSPQRFVLVRFETKTRQKGLQNNCILMLSLH